MDIKSFLPELKRPLIIAGPCAAETRAQVLSTGMKLHAFGIPVFRAGAWKPRTQPGSFEGYGKRVLPWLADLKQRTGMLIATEVATPRHVRTALEAGVDVFWIGARTTANPFAVQDIAECLGELAPGTPVMVKNPVNPDLALWIGALERLSRVGVKSLAAVHRGFSVYSPGKYRNDPCWRIPIELKHRYPELCMLCDPSHIGGRRDLIAPLAQKAIDLGFEGLIIECHCDPDAALSDASQQITPDALAGIVASLQCKNGGTDNNYLKDLRSQIDAIDDQLIHLLAQRMAVSEQIGDYKRRESLPVVQSDRYARLMNDRISQAADLGLDVAFMRSIFAQIHEESVRLQS